MDAKDLRVFEVVALYGSVKRAALDLHTVQSNVTTRIRLLEAELGVSLFERRSSGMKLTPAGVRLLPHAFEVRAAIEGARRAANDGGVPRGPLTIGSRKSTSTLHLAKLLTSYLIEFQEVDVTVRTETSPLLMDLVVERKIEGAFVCDPVENRDVVSEIIFDEELVVLTAPDVENLKQLSPTETKLIVLGQGSLYQKQLTAVLSRSGIRAQRIIQLGTLEVIMDCVAAGLGVTLLPKAVVSLASYPDRLAAHRVTDEDCRVQTLFVRRHDGFVSSALAAFLDSARAYGKMAQRRDVDG